MNEPAAPVVLSATRRSDRSRRAVRVALVCMPYASVTRPSIQVGLLAAIANGRGHAARTLHLNLEFVRELQTLLGDEALHFYEQVVEHRHSAGDWFFAAEAFGEDAPAEELLLSLLRTDATASRSSMSDEEFADVFRTIRREVVPRYLDRLLEDVDWPSFDVVGFTSSFQQNVPGFALARRLSERYPQLTILFGGANFDGEMGAEWVRSVPSIDHAISGEADDAFPAYLDALAAGRSPVGIPGVIARHGGSVVSTPPVPFEALDTNPVPDYREYFERLATLPHVRRQDVLVYHESARGCWWGERRHCTFCGLNGQTMRFRSKHPQRVLDELTELALTHRSLRFAAVDNIIDTGYYDSLLPELARRGRPFSLFYETKADLDRAQIETFVRAGIDWVQPGIESLSSRVLGLMRKGTRASWNVNVLRWSSYYGMSVAWNIIWGFPGEQPDDVDEQIRTARLLRHLEPPGSGGRLWMERFSPLFVDREQIGIEVRPHSSYQYAYPDSVDLGRAAYFFDYEMPGALPDARYVALLEEIVAWRAAVASPEPPTLLVDDDGEVATIVDRRDAGAIRHIELRGVDAAVHRACMDEPLLPERIAALVGSSPLDVEASLDRLVQDGLVLRDRKLHLALALPTAPPLVRGRLLPVPEHWRPVSADVEAA